MLRAISYLRLATNPPVTADKTIRMLLEVTPMT